MAYSKAPGNKSQLKNSTFFRPTRARPVVRYTLDDPFRRTSERLKHTKTAVVSHSGDFPKWCGWWDLNPHVL